MLVDLGGGSVEVSLIDDHGILWTESHGMGSVRLLEELGRFDRPEIQRGLRVLVEAGFRLRGFHERLPRAGGGELAAGSRWLAAGG